MSVLLRVLRVPLRVPLLCLCASIHLTVTVQYSYELFRPAEGDN